MQSLKKQYMDWYDLSKQTLESKILYPKEVREIKGIALAGMGGSGIVSDVVYSVLRSRIDKPLTIVKDFGLPSWVKRDWLVLTVSYSGNTLETLAVAKEAIERGAYLASVTSGGKLGELSKNNGFPHILIEKGRPPRASFPALLLGAFKLLVSFGALGTDFLRSISDSLEVLKNLSKAEKESIELSDFIEGRIPVFITDSDHYPLALRGKDELNENSKYLAMTQVFPESAHNDIVGWEGWFGPLVAVFIGPRNEILNYVSSYLSMKGVPIRWFDLSWTKSYLERVLWWSLVIGLASLRLAWRRGLDPEKTESIRMYKQFLKTIKMREP